MTLKIISEDFECAPSELPRTFRTIENQLNIHLTTMDRARILHFAKKALFTEVLTRDGITFRPHQARTEAYSIVCQAMIATGIYSKEIQLFHDNFSQYIKKMNQS